MTLIRLDSGAEEGCRSHGVRRQSVSGDGAFWNQRHRTALTVPFAHAKAGSPLRSAPALQVRARRWRPLIGHDRQIPAMAADEGGGRARGSVCRNGVCPAFGAGRNRPSAHFMSKIARRSLSSGSRRTSLKRPPPVIVNMQHSKARSQGKKGGRRDGHKSAQRSPTDGKGTGSQAFGPSAKGAPLCQPGAAPQENGAQPT